MREQTGETPLKGQLWAMSSIWDVWRQTGLRHPVQTLPGMKRDRSQKCGCGAPQARGPESGRDSSESRWHLWRRTQWDPRGADGGDTLHPDSEGAASEMGGKPGERSGRDAKQEGFKEGANAGVKCCQEVRQDKA